MIIIPYIYIYDAHETFAVNKPPYTLTSLITHKIRSKSTLSLSTIYRQHITHLPFRWWTKVCWPVVWQPCESCSHGNWSHSNTSGSSWWGSTGSKWPVSDRMVCCKTVRKPAVRCRWSSSLQWCCKGEWSEKKMVHHHHHVEVFSVLLMGIYTYKYIYNSSEG